MNRLIWIPILVTALGPALIAISALNDWSYAIFVAGAIACALSFAIDLVSGAVGKFPWVQIIAMALGVLVTDGPLWSGAALGLAVVQAFEAIAMTINYLRAGHRQVGR